MSNGKRIRDSLAPVVAIVALGGFGVLVNHMIGITKTADENHWNRTIYIFSGVEAIAFGAAGFFFGSEVQRRSLEKAEEKVDKLQNDANNGRALAASITSWNLSETSQKLLSKGNLPETIIANQEAKMQQIKQLAEEIYPTSK